MAKIFRPRISDLHKIDLNHPHLRGCAAYWPLLGNGREDLRNVIDPGDSLTYVGGDFTTFGLLSDANNDYLNIVGGDGKYTSGSVSILCNYRRNTSIGFPSSSLNIFGTDVLNDCTFYRTTTDTWNFYHGSSTNSQFALPDALILDGQDHCLVLIQDLGKDVSSLYVDGFEIPRNSGHTAAPHTNDIGIGARVNDFNKYSAGWISNFRIYTRPLALDEASKITLNPWAPFERKRTFIIGGPIDAVLSAAGSSTASFVGASNFDSDLDASGDSSFSAVGSALFSAEFSASGSSELLAESSAIADVVFSASGESTFSAISDNDQSTSSGWGWYIQYEQEMLRRKEEAKKRKRLEAEAKKIKNKLDREIAIELRKRERLNSRSDELKRLTALVKNNIKTIESELDRISYNIARKAINEKSYSAMSALEKRLDQIVEEDNFFKKAANLLINRFWN